ncbi:hypothetical protein ASPZODRAFT_145062 [Penicilliopsis zonata CBS 506.65]|uniref:Uncharacterized protein n=1 Tax=Penicilliopsis zonata CBS 506.65 TaxID=1073090 RepID=A0A1L9S9S9_9EURO|nr:hypothetical protein ASPZODRAFT_145062 [Penicilliopsis zonata CBS 506.65]OJJ43925.1 hypothetical protein ASPZODRAFT_145062 [Penicilliopsis zonata CBS 506.65]
MPSLPHELAHAHLNVTLALILGGMNLVEEIDFLANAHVYSGGHTKRPDQSYIPSVLPAGRSGVWPSVVIETGYPERSARWWLEESRGDVRAVISVSVHQKMRKITLTHWQAVPPRRPTRATAGQLVAQGTQEVVITQEDKDSPIEVTNGPFVVPFSSFFLRDATPGTAEKDIEWSVDSLKLLARKVWAKHPNV